MSASLFIAEQCIDRRTRAEVFYGRQIELVTGRVLLHAVAGDGRPLCDCDREQLTPIRQPWDAGYLPHLSRCGDCAGIAGPFHQVPAHDVAAVGDARLSPGIWN